MTFNKMFRLKLIVLLFPLLVFHTCISSTLRQKRNPPYQSGSSKGQYDSSPGYRENERNDQYDRSTGYPDYERYDQYDNEASYPDSGRNGQYYEAGYPDSVRNDQYDNQTGYPDSGRNGQYDNQVGYPDRGRNGQYDNQVGYPDSGRNDQYDNQAGYPDSGRNDQYDNQAGYPDSGRNGQYNSPSTSPGNSYRPSRPHPPGYDYPEYTYDKSLYPNINDDSYDAGDSKNKIDVVNYDFDPLGAYSGPYDLKTGKRRKKQAFLVPDKYNDQLLNDYEINDFNQATDSLACSDYENICVGPKRNWFELFAPKFEYNCKSVITIPKDDILSIEEDPENNFCPIVTYYVGITTIEY